MKNLLLMSIIWLTFALPALFARKASPVKAARVMMLCFSAATLLYAIYVSYGHTHFFVPKY